MNKDTIVAGIIASQVLSDILFEIRFTPYYKQKLKNQVNSTIKELAGAYKKEVQRFDEIDEQAFTFFYDELFQAVKMLSQLDIKEWNNIRVILDAYKIDKDRINGITKRILIESKDKKSIL